MTSDNLSIVLIIIGLGLGLGHVVDIVARRAVASDESDVFEVRQS